MILCFFGDGSVPQGEFHESMNLAALWKLPVVFVCENNRYAMGTAIQRALAQTDISKFAAAYGMPGEACDGMDVLRGPRVRRARGGARPGEQGADPGRGADVPVPGALDARPRGGRVPDQGRGRGREAARSDRRPARAAPRAAGLLDDAAWDALVERVEARVNDAVAFADASPEPPAEWLTADVYA